jgi:hypothetical protein
MKPELNQKELESYYKQGKTMLWQYNTLYEITQEKDSYRLEKIYNKRDKNMGVTLKGRFSAMDPVNAKTYM